MYKIGTLIFLISYNFLGCQPHSEKTLGNQSIQETQRSNTDTLNIQNARSFDLAKAEGTFGGPLSKEEFIVSENLSEFRISIYNFIKPEEYNKNEIKITERTWSKDSMTNITVWYKLENDHWVPIDVLEWPKDAEF